MYTRASILEAWEVHVAEQAEFLEYRGGLVQPRGCVEYFLNWLLDEGLLPGSRKEPSSE